MKTITLSIGNSDNKLTQEEWAKYVEDIEWIILQYFIDKHFSGGPPNNSKFQNFAWIFTLNDCNVEVVKEMVAETRKKYRQENVAWILGETEFV